MKILLTFILLIVSLKISFGQEHFSSFDPIKNFSLKYEVLGYYPFSKFSIEMDSLGKVIAEFGYRKSTDSQAISKLISRKEIQLDKFSLSQVKGKIISLYKIYELPELITDTTRTLDGSWIQLTVTSQLGKKTIHGSNPRGINNQYDKIIQLINEVVGFMAFEDEY